MINNKQRRNHQFQTLQLAAEAGLMGQTSDHAKRRYINLDHVTGHRRIMNDYFGTKPVYHSDTFRRRFCIERHLFLRIYDAVTAHDPYFHQIPNAANKPGLSSLQKITVAMRMLAYGESSDIFDEYIRIGETTSNESLKRFCRAVVEVFGFEYLRKPNAYDIQRLLAIGEERGFPGSDNEINVLDRSKVFSDLAQCRAPPARYTINGQNYSIGYYLAGGIYPSWSTIVKTISQPQGEKNKYFSKEQESLRKDVERAFEVLQARFAIVRGPVRFHDKEDLKYIMLACIIMDNMIVEDVRDMYKAVEVGRYYAIEEQIALNNPRPTMSHDSRNILFAFSMEAHYKIGDKTLHIRLKKNLVEQLWARHDMIN